MLLGNDCCLVERPSRLPRLTLTLNSLGHTESPIRAVGSRLRPSQNGGNLRRSVAGEGKSTQGPSRGEQRLASATTNNCVYGIGKSKERGTKPAATARFRSVHPRVELSRIARDIRSLMVSNISEVPQMFVMIHRKYCLPRLGEKVTWEYNFASEPESNHHTKRPAPVPVPHPHGQIARTTLC